MRATQRAIRCMQQQALDQSANSTASWLQASVETRVLRYDKAN